MANEQAQTRTAPTTIRATIADAAAIFRSMPCLRSVSFDLHGTIVAPAQPLPGHVGLTRSLLALYELGLGEIMEILTRHLGPDAAIDLFHRTTKEEYFHPDHARESTQTSRWGVANVMALWRLAERARELEGLPRSWFGGKMTTIAKRLGVEEAWALSHVGHAMHHAIEEPDRWQPTAAQRTLVAAAKDAGLIVIVYTNAARPAAAACVERHYPGIPLRHVFTPDDHLLTGKPRIESATGMLLTACLARWSRVASTDLRADDVEKAWRTAVDQSVFRSWVMPEDAAENVRFGLRMFADRLGIPLEEVERCATLPCQHLHVGNSGYHDVLPPLDASSEGTFNVLLLS